MENPRSSTAPNLVPAPPGRRVEVVVELRRLIVVVTSLDRRVSE